MARKYQFSSMASDSDLIDWLGSDDPLPSMGGWSLVATTAFDPAPAAFYQVDYQPNLPVGDIFAPDMDLISQGEPGIQAQQDAALIHLNEFRADPRFAGINGAGQTVVLIDSGVDLNHPFFGADANSNGIADRIVYSYDFTGSNDADASDGNGHGSNVASIVGSQDATYTGMAPGCNIIALKVFNDSGSGTSTDIEEALQWCVANAATYNITSINMSIGYGINTNVPLTNFLADEIAALTAGNVAVVASAGNSYYSYQTQGVDYPAADPDVWGVGAVWDRNAGSNYYWSSGAIDYTTGADRIISFSQRSTTMSEIFAPGGQITGAGPTGGTTTYSGTSQAAPHIAGLVADMQQLAVQISGQEMSVANLRSTMISSAANIVDGDDENDNVANTGATYKRVDALAWGSAILNLLYAGTAGADTLQGTSAADTIHGQGSNDILYGNGNADTLYGDAGDDTLYGGAGNDTIYGGNGNDILDGGADGATMFGGAGNDIYYNISGYQVFENANEGIDTVYVSTVFTLGANFENLVLQGSADLQGYGNSLSNAIYGNSGVNILDGGVGADTMYGGAGNDIYFVDNASDVPVESANEGADTVYSTAHLRIGANVENLILQGTADLQAYGNAIVNVIYGNSGANILDGDAGADALFGGAGNDVYYVDDAGDVPVENANEGIDLVFSTAHLRIFDNIECLILQGSANLQGYGNALTNIIYGNSGDNILNGDVGVDAMYGGAGNDAYFVDNAGDVVAENANEGTDIVFSTAHLKISENIETLVLQGSGNIQGYGNALANQLYGNSGNNLIDGGGGADRLQGGAGNDVFLFRPGETNGDRINDFTGNGAAAGDRLMFAGFGAGATFTQNDATHWQVNYNGGTSHEVITFTNAASIDPNDYFFV